MPNNKPSIERTLNDCLASIEREREREIITRRFGLFERKETLEQIGELLGITRERVRQLEKAVLIRLRQVAKEGKLISLNEFQKVMEDTLASQGSVARVSDLAAELTNGNQREDQARIAFLSELAPALVVIDDNDHYHQAVCVATAYDEKGLAKAVDSVIEAIKKIAEPASIEKIAKTSGITNSRGAQALASISKHLATLHNHWGLVKWPMVNPRNIRDKIYVILKQKGSHLHFSQIADAIKASDFKRKDVTTQAIHNELIKDKRFVLVGRGIYALKEWGYERGTVSDIIARVLKKEGAALHRDEIVKRVLKSRYVKETTILLNLQGKDQFRRVAKATYSLAE